MELPPSWPTTKRASDDGWLPDGASADSSEAVSDPFEELVELCFDLNSYLSLHPDLLKAATDKPELDLRLHFARCGAGEGRPPSPLFDIAHVKYRLARVDRIDVGPGEAFAYFASLPKANRFVPNQWFSPWAFRTLYAPRYPELANLSDYQAFEFYAARCAHAALSPNGVFSEERYRARYPDVAAAIGNGSFRAGFLHFVTLSTEEQRTSLPGSVTSHQTEARWMLAGQSDLTRIVWWFDEAFYLSIYTDVHDLVRSGAIKSGLEHYLVVGFGEGRLPAPAMVQFMPDDEHRSVWDYVTEIVARVPPRHALVALDEACDVRRLVESRPGAPHRNVLSDALWPYVLRPGFSGSFNAEHYLAVNVDVANTIGNVSQEVVREAARKHWSDHGLKEHRFAPGTDLFGDRVITFQDMISWKSGVNLFGPVSSQSGLGSAARGYAAALRAAGIEVDVYDVSMVINEKLPGDLVSPKDLKHSINFFCINADAILYFINKYGTSLFNHRANVAAWVWELMAPRPEWRVALSAFDLIVTPSKFCSDAFALFTDVPVRTVPYVVDAAALEDLRAQPVSNAWITRVEDEKRAGRRVILFIMDASSYRTRKGVDVYCELAARIDKSHPGRFLFILKTHGRDVSDAHLERYNASVFVIDSLFSAADICHLKATADLYVSPHRSEGFGLNMIESILLGVPALVSNFAGGTELLAESDPKPVPVQLVEIGTHMGPYHAKAIWAEPDLDALESGLLSFFDNEAPSASLADLRKSLAEQLSAPVIGAQLKQALIDWCAFGAEAASDRLAAFQPLAGATRNEVYDFDYVTDVSRRTPEAPGLNRLGEIVMRSGEPFFSIVTPTFNSDPKWLNELYSDLLHQSFPAWEWCLSDDGSTRPETIAALKGLRRRDARIKLRLDPKNRGIAAATNAGVAIATGHHVVMIDHDDRVSPQLLATYYDRLQGKPSDCIVYCDEDKIDLGGLYCDTYHKPDWSPEHLLSCMYVLHCLCVRKSVFLKLGGYRSEFDGAQDHDFLLRAAAAHVAVYHVDQLLYHWRMSVNSAAGDPDAKLSAIESGRRAVAAQLETLRVPGTVEHGIIAGTYRVRPTLPDKPVSLNILTACVPLPESEVSHDGGVRTFVERFVRSILEHEPEPDFLIRIVVDRHALSKAAALAHLDSRISIVPFDRSGVAFNFSEMANFALRTTETESVVLLNDDMEAIDSDWLTALLEPLQLPGVGVVGGRLLFADDTVQHCGIALGIYGAAAHLFEGLHKDTISYNAYNKIIRNYSAVTGAMFAMRRSTFDRVRGFDVTFPIDYNDVDFCLRVNEIGLRTVYTPFAQLRHYESRSARRLIADQLDRQRFCKRWADVIKHDPFYNQNLTRTGINCEPAVTA